MINAKIAALPERVQEDAGWRRDVRGRRELESQSRVVAPIRSMAYQTPSSRMYPKNTEITIDFQMPFGPDTSASWVSLVMCAEAS